MNMATLLGLIVLAALWAGACYTLGYTIGDWPANRE
jgi:hypothetical protein